MRFLESSILLLGVLVNKNAPITMYSKCQDAVLSLKGATKTEDILFVPIYNLFHYDLIIIIIHFSLIIHNCYIIFCLSFFFKSLQM